MVGPTAVVRLSSFIRVFHARALAGDHVLSSHTLLLSQSFRVPRRSWQKNRLTRRKQENNLTSKPAAPLRLLIPHSMDSLRPMSHTLLLQLTGTCTDTCHRARSRTPQASAILDSGFGSWRTSRTQSLTESVTDFQYENGRRYHAYREGSYPVPNDEREQDRLDMQHALFRMALDDRLFIAPLVKEDTQHILDVGCGTGLWCIDVADDMPNTQLLGF